MSRPVHRHERGEEAMGVRPHFTPSQAAIIWGRVRLEVFLGTNLEVFLSGNEKPGEAPVAEALRVHHQVAARAGGGGARGGSEGGERGGTCTSRPNRPSCCALGDVANLSETMQTEMRRAVRVGRRRYAPA